MPENALFDPKWPYLAIGSPSKPKWVGHWLNMAEHCQTHPGGSVWAFMAPKNVTRGPQKRSKTAFFGPKWPYLAISSPGKRKWVEHWLNMVEHCQTHPGGPVWAIRAPKNVTREPQKRPKTVFFGSKLAIFVCFWHHPVALSRGLNGFNISPWMCPVMFNQV